MPCCGLPVFQPVSSGAVSPMPSMFQADQPRGEAAVARGMLLLSRSTTETAQVPLGN